MLLKGVCCKRFYLHVGKGLFNIFSLFFFQFIFIFTFVDYSPSTYGDYKYPAWADTLGGILAVGVIAPIIIMIFYKLSKEDDNDYRNPIEV